MARRHKPSPSLKHREQPLYLLANLSYSIAELELSIRGSGPVADHDQQSTAEEVEEQRSVMRRFSCLSERRCVLCVRACVVLCACVRVCMYGVGGTHC
jgi:hypothetical protein